MGEEVGEIRGGGESGSKRSGSRDSEGKLREVQ